MPYKDRGKKFTRFFWSDGSDPKILFHCYWPNAVYIATINDKVLIKVPMYEELLADNPDHKECIDFILTDSDIFNTYLDDDGNIITDSMIPSTKAIVEYDLSQGVEPKDILLSRGAIIHPQCAGVTVEEIEGYDPEGVPVKDEDGNITGYKPNIVDVRFL